MKSRSKLSPRIVAKVSSTFLPLGQEHFMVAEVARASGRYGGMRLPALSAEFEQTQGGKPKEKI